MFLNFLITLQNYINAEEDKTEMLMDFKKKRTLSMEIEYYQYRIFKKKTNIKNNKPPLKLKVFQNIVAIFKINSNDSSFFFVFICWAGGFVVIAY